MMQIFDNALLFNPAVSEWQEASFSVEDGMVTIVGKPGSLTGDKVYDLRGARVVPGLIDAHVHIESSLLTPREFGRLSLVSGVTTVIADPHEIANVSGCAGIDFMLEDAKSSPADIFFMIPSCVPATPMDKGGAVVSSEDVASYKNTPSVIGLGEMMNVPGVLFDDPEVTAKLAVFDHIDGHAPGLSGEALCRYVSHHIKTDHECISAAEAHEKLSLGMYVLLREGDAAKNVAALSEIVNDLTAARCCFCTDDRHADSRVREGSIDHCIRTAVKSGMRLELALRLATLSAAECFGLADRGMIAPGRVADFCVLQDGPEFLVSNVYNCGVPASSITKPGPAGPCICPPFSCRIPTKEELVLPKGNLRVIGLVPGEIITEALESSTAGSVHTVVSVDRYRSEGFGVGLVKGFSFAKGAIAASISHDAHNIISAGVTDEEIISAVTAVKDSGGGMAVVCDGITTVLPLPCGGLMTPLPYEDLIIRMDELASRLQATGAPPSAFMNLSFLSLTVIPHLRITPRGLFDGDTFKDVPILFEQGKRLSAYHDIRITMNFTRFLSLFMIAAFLLLLVPGQALADQGVVITLPDDNQTVDDDNTSVFVEGSNRYGYLTVDSIEVTPSGTDVEITVHYSVTPWIAFLVFLFGKQDLKNRVLSVVGYPETGKDSQVVTYTYVDNSRAVITVKNAVINYGDGSYWYPAHTFGTVIPKLTFILGPNETKTYTNTQVMPKGFGYFQ